MPVALFTISNIGMKFLLVVHPTKDVAGPVELLFIGDTRIRRYILFRFVMLLGVDLLGDISSCTIYVVFQGLHIGLVGLKDL